jgi:MoxR-like ATPase
VTPQELTPYLSSLVKNKLQLSLMLWGPPGIGKSSIVADVAEQNGLELVDLRFSQLPLDLQTAFLY